MTQSLLRLDAVKSRTGLSRSAIYKLMADGRFPRSIAVAGTRARAWSSVEIDAWIEQQVAGATTTH